MTGFLIYLTIGMMFTLWVRSQFDWAPEITPAKKMFGVFMTIFAWPVVVLLVAFS